MFNSILCDIARHARLLPYKPAVIIYKDPSSPEALTYRELLSELEDRATTFRNLGLHGSRVLIPALTEPEFAPSFFGAMRAGAVPVPTAGLVQQDPDFRRLSGIIDRCRPSAAVWPYTQPVPEGLATALERAGVPLLGPSELRRAGPAPAQRQSRKPRAADPAFIQFTSGSTSAPKGVCISHGNLSANLKAQAAAYVEHGPDEVVVSWLPLFHDMGLIGMLCGALHVGGSVVLISPVTFVRSPAIWLHAATRYRATLMAGPNFGFDLCARIARPALLAKLDLSTCRTVIVGAEMISRSVLMRFADAYRPAGFDAAALRPSYGLAEATLVVSSAARGAFSAAGPTAPVACGAAVAGHHIVIVDPERRAPVPAGDTGEIWVSGPSVATAYWDDPTGRRVFGQSLPGIQGRTFLRTGDLGRIEDGDLVIAGRLKDLIVVRGQNIHAADVEEALATAPELNDIGRTAAFGCEDTDGEGLVVLMEVGRAHLHRADAMLGAASRVTYERFRLRPRAIGLVAIGALPKTSSGKVRRHEARALYELGSVELLARRTGPSRRLPDALDREAADGPALTVWLLARLRNTLGAGLVEADLARPFSEIGLESGELAAIASEAANRFQITLDETDILSAPSFAVLIARLIGGEGAQRQGPADALPGRCRTAGAEEAIAIVGMSCRFPGARDPRELWRLLSAGNSAIIPPPPERKGLHSLHPKFAGGYLPDIAGFDPGFFGISDHEALRIDPQQRLLLELAWEALEDAAIAPASLIGSHTGVFIGISGSEYPLGRAGADDLYAATGSALSIAANRISYALDLAGPSVAIDTACASSLTATHYAARALLAGEADLCLAGGVNLILSARLHGAFHRAGLLSADSVCRPFDEGANGYVRSEGGGVVTLKRLSQALADRDRIYAVIRGSAIGHDGRTNGLTAPSARAQATVVTQAWSDAGLSPASAVFIEAHGTGTVTGDHAEAVGLGRALGATRPADTPLPIGSLKSNLGHMEAAAGVGGLVKAALAVYHGELPATVNCRNPSNRIPFADLGLEVATQARVLPARPEDRIAGVSAFGFGGALSHVVLQGIGQPAAGCADSGGRGARLPLPISGVDRGDVVDQANRLLRECAGSSTIDFVDVVRSLALGHDHRRFRTVVPDHEGDLGQSLANWISTQPAQIVDSGTSARQAFVFSGRVERPWDLAGLASASSLETAQGILRICDDALREVAGFGLSEAQDAARDAIARGEMAERYAQPLHVACQVALAEQAIAWGARPDVCFGHSLGEISAACVSGAMPPADAIRLAASRGESFHAGRIGAMALVATSEEQLEQSLAAFTGRLWVAARNAPAEIIVSGEVAAIEELLADLAGRKVFCRRISGVSIPSHTPMADEAAKHLEVLSPPVRVGAPKRCWISTRTGKQIEDAVGSDHWVRNLVEPVEFRRVVEQVLEAAPTVFLEFAPRPTLRSAILACNRDGQPGPAAICTGAADVDQPTSLRASIAQLWAHGAEVDWLRIGAGEGRPATLPPRPWRHRRLWLDPADAHPSADAHGADGLMNTGATSFAWRPPAAAETPGDMSSAGSVGWEANLAWLMAECVQRALGESPVALEDLQLSPPPDGSTPKLAVELRPGGPGAILVEVREVRSQDDPDIVVARARARHNGRPTRAGPSGAFSRGAFLQAFERVHSEESGRPGLQVATAASLNADGNSVQLDAISWRAPISRSGDVNGYFHRLVWIEVEGGPAPPDPLDGTILIVAGDALAAGALTRACGHVGLVTEHVDAHSITDRLASLTSSGERTRLVMLLSGLSSERASPLSLLSDFIRVARGVRETAAAGADVRLWLAAPPGPINDPIIAAAQSAALEIGECFAGVLELDPAEDNAAQATAIAQKIADDPVSAPRRRLSSGREFGPRVERLPTGEVKRKLRPLRAEASYLVTGAFGGIGQSLCLELAAQGARHLLLPVRPVRNGSGPPDSMKALLAQLTASGCSVDVRQVDLSNGEDLDQALRAWDTEAPPVRGIFHLAGEVTPGLLFEASPEVLARQWAVKVGVAARLSEWSEGRSLDHFVLFSSLAAVLPSPGLAAYAAANAALDRLAHDRTARGLAALVIDWGFWGEAGMASRLAARAGYAGSGLGLPFSNADALAGLMTLMQSSCSAAMFAAPNWAALAAGPLGRFEPTLFSDVAEPQSPGGATAGPLATRAEIAGLSPDAARSRVTVDILARAAHVLGCSPGSLRLDEPPGASGLDSLMALQLINGLTADYGATLDPTRLLSSGSLTEVVEEFARELTQDRPAEEPAPSSDDGLGLLSERELEVLLGGAIP